MTSWLIDKSAIGRLHLASNALEWAIRIDRGLVRKAFEERFSAMRMARDYVAIYEGMLDRSSSGARIDALTTA